MSLLTTISLEQHSHSTSSNFKRMTSINPSIHRFNSYLMRFTTIAMSWFHSSWTYIIIYIIIIYLLLPLLAAPISSNLSIITSINISYSLTVVIYHHYYCYNDVERLLQALLVCFAWRVILHFLLFHIDCVSINTNLISTFVISSSHFFGKCALWELQLICMLSNEFDVSHQWI